MSKKKYQHRTEIDPCTTCGNEFLKLGYHEQNFCPFCGTANRWPDIDYTLHMKRCDNAKNHFACELTRKVDTFLLDSGKHCYLNKRSDDFYFIVVSGITLGKISIRNGKVTKIEVENSVIDKLVTKRISQIKGCFVGWEVEV